MRNPPLDLVCTEKLRTERLTVAVGLWIAIAFRPKMLCLVLGTDRAN